jgi:hypothetical protein
MSTFKIGTIVALKNHYAKGSDKIMYEDAIVGDYHAVPPLMIVIETLVEKPDNPSSEANTDSGISLKQNHLFKLKCIWFNTSNYSFEEAWISSKQVVRMDSSNNDFFGCATLNSDSPISIGATVVLRTNKFENLKRRIVFRSKENGTGYQADSFEKFAAPEFIVVGSQAYVHKESLVNPKTGEVVRKVPSRLVKVKFYNPSSSKFSEFLLPLECLEKMDDFEKLGIAKNEFYLVKYFGEKFFGKVASMLLQNGVPTIVLETSNSQFQAVQVPFIQKLLRIKFDDDARQPRWDDSDYININWGEIVTWKGKYCMIEYLNRRNVISKRLIKIIDTFPDPTSEDVVMIKAFCFLRRTGRTFKFEPKTLISVNHVVAEGEMQLEEIIIQVEKDH